jgi:DNA sulfur modification protein DndD
MYLSKLQLKNWRSYADATFEFNEPTARKSVVLIGAMNGHGKTSFLVSLYLGLFGKFGLRHCEGFSRADGDDVSTYRQAIERYRRNVADPDDPSVIDITLTPTLGDSDEEDVRVVRRWFFTGKNMAKPGESFEEVDIYIGGRLQKRGDFDKDPLTIAHDRLERNLFPAHVAPAFFFDGEQAQKLIENMGEVGLKKAVEVMFGTKVLGELSETMSQYLIRCRSTTGGKKKSSERQTEFDTKVKERDELNQRIARLQGDHIKLEREKDEKESQRTQLQEDLARMGGAAGADAAKLQGEYTRLEKEQNESEKALGEIVRSMGFALGISRLAPAIVNRLKAEQLREVWENLRRGTIENKEKVLSVALPEPPEADPLLGNIAPDVRMKVRTRFLNALESIYNPPAPDCAKEYLLGHVKGEARAKVLLQLAQAQASGSGRIVQSAKRVREARENLDEIKGKIERFQHLPQTTKDIREQLDKLNIENQDISRKLGLLEAEIRKFKSDLHTINEEIGRIQEELARLGPEQKRIAVAERVGRALDDLMEQLKPTTTARLEQYVTKYFRKIADTRFATGMIRLPVGMPPEIELENGQRLALEAFSGFEKRSFGIAFSLALAEITKRRIPLVIDTPLGNADSEYRPRTLKTLAEFDLDQVIVLTHDEEVTSRLMEHIESSIRQTFLVEFQGSEKGSIVHPNQYFKR